MILTVQRHVHDAIADAIRRQFGIADVPPFAVEVPPNRALGDLAVTVAFQLARTLRKAPRAIAQELAPARRRRSRASTRIVAAPNGYLNLYLDRAAFLIAARPAARCRPSAAPPEKTIVEHTAINPNKAAHIGHLRNAALGDTLVRVLRFRGTPVEVAELHRRHRRPGRRRHRRVPGARAPDARRRAARSPTRRGSTTTAGISTRASPSGTTATRRGSRSAPRRCTTSSTAATTPPRWARSSSTASCART